MPNEEWLSESVKVLLRAAAESASTAMGGAELGIRMPTPIVKEEVPLLGLYVLPLVDRRALGTQRTFAEQTPTHAQEWAKAFRDSLLETLRLWIQMTGEEAKRSRGDPTQAVAALEKAVKIVEGWRT